MIRHAREADLMRQIDDIRAFLPCATPVAWIERALEEQDILLIDHANCEKKAANTALGLMFRYVEDPALLAALSKLAREELLHFEQVVEIMHARGVHYRTIDASRYAKGMRELVRSHEPARLVDTLIAGAFIEARSCERFAALETHLDQELGKFYRSLLRSEARHFQDYLSFAQTAAGDADITNRVALFAEREAELINSPDAQFRFHSGIPA